ncbi:hypothetical protein CEUSTIGMA_g3980.t1 [Chlamydomonas eustigma]|uniref:Anaphase-promoting complex subunit 11 n=1 Tax=Chlamydomonas eustigma TaxID=1157962 RepID=A0A250X0B8_9CHLO|nr:hypothetical protein CEUSTIGMA_g3980.t1 [Chlamydomonas eustigma]|eukprot:GAX76534.1 hypothetical protein CEUSTIGMA_g3980.t1 [Chlamydomonas eustigma]
MTFCIAIKHWHAVAEWTWAEGDDEVCGICRGPYDGCAPDVKYPGDDSPVVWGSCAHAFHLQCIQKWLASSAEQGCPMCRREWQYKSASGQQDDVGQDSAVIEDDEVEDEDRDQAGSEDEIIPQPDDISDSQPAENDQHDYDSSEHEFCEDDEDNHFLTSSAGYRDSHHDQGDSLEEGQDYEDSRDPTAHRLSFSFDQVTSEDERE